MRIDGRSEVKPRFGYREKSGATETLISQKVDYHENGRPMVAPTMDFMILRRGDSRIARFFIYVYSFVFGRRNASPTRNFHMHRRSEEIACNLFAACRLPFGRPPFVCGMRSFFRDAEDVIPYKETHRLCRDRPPGRSAPMPNNFLKNQGLGGSRCGSCHKSCLRQLNILTVHRTVIHSVRAASLPGSSR